jgi:NAD+ synthase
MIKERLVIQNPHDTCKKLEDFIGTSMEKSHKAGCILGISGGLDSALVAYLAVRAVGKENVMGIFMPERDTSKKSYNDARMLADVLGISFKEIDIKPILRKIGVYGLEPPAFYVPRSFQEKYVYNKNKKLSRDNEPTFLRMLKGGEGDRELQKHIAYINTKHRIRMIYLYYYGEINNYMVLGTANKSEYMTGFFVKYGDAAADIQPLLPFYKTQIIELSKAIMLPDSIINKAPAPDLMPGMGDEDVLGISYESLDMAIAGLEWGLDEEKIAEEARCDISQIAYIKRLMELSSPLRELPKSPQI